MRPADWRWICDRIRRAGVVAHDVEDVAQEVTIAMHRTEERRAAEKSDPLPETERRALLLGIICRRVSEHWRGCGRHRERAADAAELAEIPDTEPTPEALALARAEAEPLRAALAELERTAPDKCAILVAHQLDERPMDEIAASLGIPTNTAWNRLRLARRAVFALVVRCARRRACNEADAPRARRPPPSACAPPAHHQQRTDRANPQRPRG